MIREQIDCLANHLRDQKELIFKQGYTHASVLMSEEEIEYLLKHLYDHKEPTYEEIMDYCKARHLYLMTYSGAEQFRVYQPYNGMTNGEVIENIFPEVKVERDGFLVRCVFIEHEFTTTEDWWDSPYKKEVQNEM